MKIALGAALAMIIAAVAALFFGQGNLLYPVPRPARTPGPELGELIELRSTVATWIAPLGTSPVIIHFHGNAEQLATLGPVVSPLRARGLGVLAVEYPGYGLAKGAPSQRPIVAAAVEAFDFAVEQLRVPPERLVVQGQSLGSAVAAQLVAQRGAARLVLISPFTSVQDFATRLFPSPARHLVRDRFDTRAIAPGIRIPVLIIHGTDDELVPFAMGEELARSFPAARLMRVQGGGHNDLWARHATVLASAITHFAKGE